MVLLFQICSDLHLEFHDRVSVQQFIEPIAKYLIIAGDLGHPRLPNYRSFLEQASRLFEKVFLISGNHEHYQESFTSCHERIQALLIGLPNNIIYLYNTSYEFPEYNLVLLGTTLWSHIKKEEEEHIVKRIADYHQILSINHPHRWITVHEVNQQHKHDLQWLTNELNTRHQLNQRIIVITHHLPCYQLISPKFKSCALNSSFASQLDYLMDKDDKSTTTSSSTILYWISGHTHQACIKQINHVTCIVNPHGYPHEPTHFNRQLVIKIHLQRPIWDLKAFHRSNVFPTVIGQWTSASTSATENGMDNATMLPRSPHRLLNLPLYMPDQGWKIPPYLIDLYGSLLSQIHTYEEQYEEVEQHYVYITIDQKPVLPHQTQRRPGFHSDSYVCNPLEASQQKQTMDHIYLIMDQLPTEFVGGPFPLDQLQDPSNCTQVLSCFHDKGIQYPIRTYPLFSILLLNPYMIHRAAVNSTDSILPRTFIKIVYSRHQFNMQGNDHNDLFNYTWNLHVRNPLIRNHVSLSPLPIVAI